jgi:putative OPT family oligopeptide transporter
MSSLQVGPQLTARAIILAVILAAVLAAANSYLGLFAGMTIASAIPSAVVSMAVLKLLGGGGILENNIVQTGGSAGTSLASGVIFTIPALVILGFWQDFNFWWVLAISGLGGVLGVLFSVPLRRSLICDQQLAFPEGKAAAEVLRAGENPSQGIKVLGSASLGGALMKLAAASGLHIIPDSAAVAGNIGSGLFYVGTDLSPALLGVGYILGLNVGIVIVAGGVLSWDIGIPI